MAQEWATFTFGEDGEERRFRDYDQLDQWLVLEKSEWEWLHTAAGGFNNAGANVINAFETLRQQAMNNKAHGNPLQEMAGTIGEHYSTRGWLMLSKGQSAATLSRIRERLGDKAAGFAFAFHRGQINLGSAQDPSQLAGAMLFALPELDRPAEIAKRLQQERASYRSAITSTLDRLRAEEDQRTNRWREYKNRGVRFLVKQMKRAKLVNSRTNLLLEEKAADAIASIGAVEESYRVAMGLQAPVQYWDSKASKHKIAEGQAFTRLLWFFPMAFFLFAGAFGVAAWLLLDADRVHQTVYLIVAAGLASIAALIFWVGRLLTKLYLSQHHLRHDAEERAVMTTTYLALTHESAAGEEDKKIILASLFRPTVDGLVKDDGPSDLTLAGILSKLGAGR